MAESSKLELILLAKDQMSPALQRLLKLLKQTQKDGKTSTDAVDKLTKKLERAPKTDGLQKHNAEIKKTATVANAAAQAEEKLNNARKRGVTAGKSGRDVSDRIKLASATEKAAAAEEKLNRAYKRGADGRLRDGRGKFVSDGRTSPGGRRSRNQNGFEDDLIQGGTGAGILWAAKQGITSAMSKQEGLTDLYNSFYRSSLGAAELNKQMREGEKIADDLGNRLPGTTAEYLTMFATMKQRGIEANSILNGAGKSAAYLAVANKEDRQDVGKNIARFGQMFNLKTESEYMGAADLMSRANTTYGINSAELMEAVKDFSGRAGKGLGLDGGKGAEDTLRFLSFLRAKTGLEGLTVGTAGSSFFNQYQQAKNKKVDPTDELKKLTGVKPQIFDQKGKFLGLENAVKEFSKLNGKLSDEQMGDFGSKIAGEEGKAVFMAMVKNGEQFGAFNKEMTESASLQDKSAKNAQNLTNKIEALTGSLSNLGAAGFTPIVEPLGKLADGTNKVVGSLTDMAKAYPTTAATTAGVLTLGGAFLALKGGSGVLSRLTNATALVGSGADGSTKKVGKLGKSLGSLPTALKIGLTIEMLGIAWEQVERLRETIQQWRETNTGLDDAGKMSHKAQQQEDETLKAKNQAPDYKKRAEEAMGLLQAGSKQFEKSLDPSRMSWGDSYAKLLGAVVSGEVNDGFYLQGKSQERWKKLSPQEQEADKKAFSNLAQQYSAQPVPSIFKNGLDRAAKEMLGAEAMQRRVPMLADPNTMTSFRKDTLPGLNLSSELNQHVQKILERGFPESYKQSNQQMLVEYAKLADQSGQLGQSFSTLLQPTGELGTGFSNLNTNSNNAVTGVNSLAAETANAAARISAVQFTPPTFAPINIPVYGQPQAQPPAGRVFGGGLFNLGRAKGGSMTRGHEYRINEIGQEFFTPNASGSMVANDVLRSRRNGSSSSQNVTINAPININGSNGDAVAIAEQVRRELSNIVSDIKSELSSDRLARRVAYSAERDGERV